MNQRESSSGSGEQFRTYLTRMRTFLSNERTFLAWLRTGFELIVLGLVAAELLRSSAVGISLVITEAVSIGLIVSGIFVAFIGASRYRHTVRQVDGQQFRPAGISINATTLLICLVGLASIALVLTAGTR